MEGGGRSAGSIETSRELLSRIQSRSARVGVIGQGYVGLPLALVFREAGFPVIGFDVDPTKVEALRRGESFIRHISPDRRRQERGRAARGARRSGASTAREGETAERECA